MGKGGKGRSQVNVSPQHIPYGFTVAFEEGSADIVSHYNIIQLKAQKAKNAARNRH
jgi:hypothetical protein